MCAEKQIYSILRLRSSQLEIRKRLMVVVCGLAELMKKGLAGESPPAPLSNCCYFLPFFRMMTTSSPSIGVLPYSQILLLALRNGPDRVGADDILAIYRLTNKCSLGMSTHLYVLRYGEKTSKSSNCSRSTGLKNTRNNTEVLDQHPGL